MNNQVRLQYRAGQHYMTGFAAGQGPPLSDHSEEEDEEDGSEGNSEAENPHPAKLPLREVGSDLPPFD